MDAAVIRAAPMTLVSNARRHVCTSTSVRRARGPIPVAYTRPSMPPSPVAASSIAAWPDEGSVTSQAMAICPECRSRSWKPTEVSGRGTVVAFTVNAHPWLPGFDPPYVVANVVLTEDPTVHLTTNIIGCEPSEVHIGQEVVVRFEPHGDAW